MSNVRQGKINDNSSTIVTNKNKGSLNGKALLISGSTLKTITNKVLEGLKESINEVLSQTEPEVFANEQTPLINPIYSGTPAVELGSKVAGFDVTQAPPTPVIEPVIQTPVPEQKVMPNPVQGEDSITIPHIVPPTISVSAINEPQNVPEFTSPVIEPVPQSVDLAREEASVKEAIDMATINPQTIPVQPEQILQTPQEFNTQEENQNVLEEANRVSDIYIRTLSDLVAKKERMEKTLLSLEEANSAQAKAINELKIQISEFDNIMRNIEEARKSQMFLELKKL